MSRRHHGRSRHHGRPRPEAPTSEPSTAAAPPVASDVSPAALAPTPVPPIDGTLPPHVDGSVLPAVVPGDGRGASLPTVANGALPVNGSNGVGSCTAPQLRRFIKSRPYVPMHELRRRFGINGSDDDVTQVRMDGGAIYVGLPPREGGLLGDLLRGGEIGYELSLDPRTPIVVGVYPMRPVPRA
jgi:hypothetical protein